MGILYWLAIFTTFCTCSTFSGATAADATSSSFSPQNGEYASRYKATSSSLVKTHSLPTAPLNCFIASAKSLALTPGGTFIPCSYLNAPCKKIADALRADEGRNHPRNQRLGCIIRG